MVNAKFKCEGASALGTLGSLWRVRRMVKLSSPVAGASGAS